MSGLCGCGCGTTTVTPSRSDTAKGWVKGVPLRYRKGHNFRSAQPEYVVDVETGCWNWARHRDQNGYGRTGRALAHRAMYMRLVGPIPDGLQLDHLCRNPACVNPDHLEPVTNAENSRRGNMTRLTWEDVREIRESTEPHTVVAARYGVHPVHIGQIRAGKAWGGGMTTGTVFIPRDGSEYTDHPTGVKVEFREASHRYWLHHDADRIAVPSVTGVLKVLSRDALIPWAEARGIQGAVKAVALGEIDPSSDESAANAVSIVRTLGLGADAARDEGAGRGTALHGALELYVTKGEVPAFDAFPAQHRGYVQALCRWLISARPEPSAVEVCVGSIEHEFAGRLDLRATIDGEDLVVDLKTNAAGRVYDEPHLQCAAYMLAHVECGAAHPDGGLIVALGEDGNYDARRCEATAQDFLDVLGAHHAIGRLRKSRQARERAAKKAAA